MLAAALMLGTWVAVAGYCLLLLARLWREPVLRRPVVILESDDWGPGPEQHAESLRRLADLLVRFRDSRGRHPTMTLAVVLAVPDTEHMRIHGTSGYSRVSLSAPRVFGDNRCHALGRDAGSVRFTASRHGTLLAARLAGCRRIRSWHRLVADSTGRADD
jgi:hypothetical protein